LTEASTTARVVVAQPQIRFGEPDPLGTVNALRRLGSEIVVDQVRTAASCRSLAFEENTALVVIDMALGAEAFQLLDELANAGPPVVVVHAEPLSQTILKEVFRHGAVDCVAARDDFENILPVVALEHLRRWRTQREKGVVERRIRSLEGLNDVIVNEIPAALAVIDAQGRIVMLNPKFRAFSRIDQESVSRVPLEDLMPAQIWKDGGLGEMVRKAMAGSEIRGETVRARDGNGLLRTYDLRAEHFGEERNLLIVLTDITERATLMGEIETLRRYNENIIRGMNSALVVVDNEGTITRSNRVAEEILGEAALPGHSLWDWFSDIPRPEIIVSRTLDEGLRFNGAEVQIKAPDGSGLEIGISCAPLVDADGTSQGAIAIFQDLTEIKALQRQVLQKEKMASIGLLAAGVAHEINNPMGFIHANLFQMGEYLKEILNVWSSVTDLQEAVGVGDLKRIQTASASLTNKCKEVDSDFVFSDFGKALQESLEGSERIRHIVRDLRDFSHQDTGDRVPSNINQCIDTTVNLVWSMMKYTVILHKEYADLPEISAYPMQLKQVFMNLLVNSYHAIQESVGDTGERGEIFVRTEVADGGIVITVRDNGIGIPKHHLDRIFDPFFTTKTVGKGTGLGLSTTFNIVRRHGGTIDVATKVGEGTTFTIFLPSDEQAAHAQGEDAAR